MNLLEAILVTGTLLIFLLIIMLILLVIFLRRASRVVIDIFRKHKCLDEESAKTREELGIVDRKLVERMVKPRDYKPHALQFLINLGVINVTSNEKLYLSEDMLAKLMRKKYEEDNKLEMWSYVLPPERTE